MKFNVDFEVVGGLQIEAENEVEAIKKVMQMSNKELVPHIFNDLRFIEVEKAGPDQ